MGASKSCKNRVFGVVGCLWLIFATIPVAYELISFLSLSSSRYSAGIIVLVCLINFYIPIACLHLSCLPISHQTGRAEAFVIYTRRILLRIFVIPLLRLMRAYRLRNVSAMQERLLMKAIRPSIDTEYGRKYRFDLIKSRKDFIRQHPLTTYDNYRPYVTRLEADRNDRSLSQASLSKFAISSGTTGLPKRLPFYNLGISRYMFDCATQNNIIIDYEIATNFLAPQASMAFSFWPIWRWTKSGIPIGPGSVFLEGPAPWISPSIFGRSTTPQEAHKVFFEERGKLYVHWLFALRDRNLGVIDGVFCGGLLRSIEYLLENWQQLVEDIRHGTLSDDFGIPETQHYLLRAMLKADEPRATELEQEMLKGKRAILRRIFPNLRYVRALLSAAQKVYWTRLREVCGDDLPVYSCVYAGSESFMGANIDAVGACEWSRGDNSPICYTDLGIMLEFIPLENCGDEQPPTLLPEQLEVGGFYEIVITAPGYFRYRIGDVIRCAGFKHSTPQIELSHRLGNLLDLRGEKTSENVLNMSVERFASSVKAEMGELIDYTATESVCLNDATGTDLKQGYVIFMEFSGNGKVSEVASEDVDRFDAILVELNELYRQFRETGFIERVKIVLVRRGAFHSLMLSILERNKAVSNQFKTPRTFKDAANLSLLWKHRAHVDVQ